jgi:hypothetical protein
MPNELNKLLAQAPVITDGAWGALPGGAESWLDDEKLVQATGGAPVVPPIPCALHECALLPVGQGSCPGPRDNI